MKTMMNFTTSSEDTIRYSSAEELKQFYEEFGCAGLELMPMEDNCPLIRPEMVVGIHTRSIADWMNLDRCFLIEHYRKDLEFARQMNAEYVVFHITQVSNEESFTYRMQHTDEEVIDAICDLINELLDGQGYSFHFLMENLWWPGLNFLRPSITKRLLDGVHYEKKGLMLDTGHYLHTNHKLRTQKEALDYLNTMLDAHEEFLPYIKGIHLQQSLTGEYVEEWLKTPHELDPDPSVSFGQVFTHIFAIDLHKPFTEPGVKEMVERVDPEYVTYEYITSDKEQHAQYLREGRLN